MEVELLQPKLSVSRNTSSRLIKISKKEGSSELFGAYEDGQVFLFDLNKKKINRGISLYKKMPVIDFAVVDDCIVSCTHTELTIHNIEKCKSVSLKGHESTPMFLAVHPICPCVLSCSNLLLLHDIRVQKPINVQFITPPAYGLEYFPDGQFYLESGQPCRIGNTRWVRTLMNGIGSVSRSGKHIVTNDLDGKICMWDWRDSKQLLSIPGVKNRETYQAAYFGTVEGRTRSILFLDEDSCLMVYDILKQQRRTYNLQPQDNSKMYIDRSPATTHEFFRYTHNGLIQMFEFEA